MVVGILKLMVEQKMKVSHKCVIWWFEWVRDHRMDHFEFQHQVESMSSVGNPTLHVPLPYFKGNKNNIFKYSYLLNHIFI